jgi:HK97 family phage prohead protease
VNLLTKHMSASVKAVMDATATEGRVTALVSTYNVDKEGDRIMPGAFQSSIDRLEAIGGSLPILTSHDWVDPQAIVGHALPEDIVETKAGLVITFRLDLDSPAGAAVWKAIKNGSLREFSVGFRAVDGATRKGSDGAFEISDLDLVEVSVCHRGVNPDTRVLAVKADLPEADTTADPSAELVAYEKALSMRLAGLTKPEVAEPSERVKAFLREQEAEALMAKAVAAETAERAERWRAEEETLRLRAQASQMAVARGEAVPVVVDAHFRPVSPTLTAQRAEEETRTKAAADRARAERLADAEKLDAIADRHKRPVSILGQPPEMQS